MHFTGTIWRPPYEAGSALLQVTVGCTHHKCRFCSLYKDPFSLSPMSEIREDIEEIARFAPRTRRVWLTGANPFGIGEAKLVPILKVVRDALPGIRTIGGFARIADIARKSDDDLARWAELGVDGLTIGVESGHDPSLAFMDKGHTAADIVEQCRRLDDAGIGYYFFYLSGMAGRGRCVEAARASAETFNQTHPRIVGVLSMTLFPDSRLADDVRKGRFVPAGELERLEETRELASLLEIETTFSTAHVSDTVTLEGRLPRDRGRIVSALDRAIATLDESDLRRYRRLIRSL